MPSTFWMSWMAIFSSMVDFPMPVFPMTYMCFPRSMARMPNISRLPRVWVVAKYVMRRSSSGPLSLMGCIPAIIALFRLQSLGLEYLFEARILVSRIPEHVGMKAYFLVGAYLGFDHRRRIVHRVVEILQPRTHLPLVIDRLGIDRGRRSTDAGVRQGIDRRRGR